MSSDSETTSFDRRTVVMGLGALAVAVGWVVWIVRAYRDPAETEAPLPPVASAPVAVAPAAPVPETPQAECARLWKAGQGGELIKAMNRWLSMPTHPVAELVAWLLHLEAGPARDAAMVGIAPQLPPEPRLALAVAVTKPEVHRRLLSEALAAWEGSDASATLAWLDQHKDDPAHFSAQTALLTAWAVKEPREVAKYVSAAAGDAAQQDRMVLAIIKRWLPRDAAATGSWVEILSDSRLQFVAAEALVSTWAEADEPSAADWVEQLPTGALRDHGLSALGRCLAGSDAEAARQCAEQISDPQMRQVALAALGVKQGQ